MKLGSTLFCKLNSDEEVDPFQEEVHFLPKAYISNWFMISITLFELNENEKKSHVTLNSCSC